MLKTCLPANSGGTNAVFGSGVYEHTVRDETDLQRCADYIHFNPVKHGLCGNVRDWAFSSFHRYVRDGWLPLDWGGTKETAVMSFGE